MSTNKSDKDISRKRFWIIDFPENRQTKRYTCGCIVVKSVLTFCGKKILEEDELIKVLNATPRGGVDPQRIINFFKKRKIDIEYGTIDTEELKEYIEKGFPVILALQAWTEEDLRKKKYDNVFNSGHYVVVIGFTNDGFVFEDPSLSSSRGYLMVEELEKRWHDVDKYGNRYYNFAIVIKCKSKYVSKKLLRIKRNLEIKKIR